jgi:predicted ATPase
MRILDVRLQGLRCFDDSGIIHLAKNFNIFVGQNNSGKTTLLKGVLEWQGFPFTGADCRLGSRLSACSMTITGLTRSAQLNIRAPNFPADVTYLRVYKGVYQERPDPNRPMVLPVGGNGPAFSMQRPDNLIVPFLSKRTAHGYDQSVNLTIQTDVRGNFSNLYSRIDQLATSNPRRDIFNKSCREVIGLEITTKASPNGKTAGFYLDEDTFVTLDQMGDGVAEMVALIVELCVERGKVFVLEEPETHLHPRGLKALLSLIRTVSRDNQFLVATHSNIVVRELGVEEEAKVFRVFRDDDTDPTAPSSIEEVPKTPIAHTTLLRELGYEFSDVGLYESWLFLEEASAESIINKVLIPIFVPTLKGKLRTFACDGVTNVQPTVSEFQRLVTFVHLEPAYVGRIWVRTDGDTIGIETARKLRDTFHYLDEQKCTAFSKPQFENFYPENFDDRTKSILAIGDKKQRRQEKAALLLDVLKWTKENPDGARVAWRESAGEPIAMLGLIDKSLAD